MCCNICIFIVKNVFTSIQCSCDVDLIRKTSSGTPCFHLAPNFVAVGMENSAVLQKPRPCCMMAL